MSDFEIEFIDKEEKEEETRIKKERLVASFIFIFHNIYIQCSFVTLSALYHTLLTVG